jgi:hypothetical protein
MNNQNKFFKSSNECNALEQCSSVKTMTHSNTSEFIPVKKGVHLCCRKCQTVIQSHKCVYCQKCNIAIYCSDSCRDQHWEIIHKNNCTNVDAKWEITTVQHRKCTQSIQQHAKELIVEFASKHLNKGRGCFAINVTIDTNDIQDFFLKKEKTFISLEDIKEKNNFKTLPHFNTNDLISKIKTYDPKIQVVVALYEEAKNFFYTSIITNQFTLDRIRI